MNDLNKQQIVDAIITIFRIVAKQIQVDCCIESPFVIKRNHV